MGDCSPTKWRRDAAPHSPWDAASSKRTPGQSTPTAADGKQRRAAAQGSDQDATPLRTPEAARGGIDRTAVGSMDAPATPQECAAMIHAVEAAAAAAAEAGSTPGMAPNLHAWVRGGGGGGGGGGAPAGPAPTPARRELAALLDAAREGVQLRQQLDMLREAELDIATREAEETARGFGVLEEENAELAATNTRLAGLLQEAQARADAARAAAEAAEAEAEAMRARMEETAAALVRQQEDAARDEEAQRSRLQEAAARGPPPAEGAEGVERTVARALRRAVEARQLSDACQAQQVEAFRALEAAETHLRRVEAMAEGTAAGTVREGRAGRAGAAPRPSGETRPGRPTATPAAAPAAQPPMLVEAQAAVQAAATAASDASGRLSAALAERDALAAELRALQQRLEAVPAQGPRARSLLGQLKEARRLLREERDGRAAVTDALLGHAGRLRRKYRHLEGRYDALGAAHQQMRATNDALSAQLAEARSVVQHLQAAGRAALAATPPGAVAQRREAERVLRRLQEAHGAVSQLEGEGRQLGERLLQAEGFMARLRVRVQGGTAGAPPALPSPAAPGCDAAAPSTPAASPLVANSAAADVDTPPLLLPSEEPRGAVEDAPPLSPLLARARDAPATASAWAAVREELDSVADGHKSLASGLARAKSALSVLGRALTPLPPAAGGAASEPAAAPALWRRRADVAATAALFDTPGGATPAPAGTPPTAFSAAIRACAVAGPAASAGHSLAPSQLTARVEGDSGSRSSDGRACSVDHDGEVTVACGMDAAPEAEAAAAAEAAMVGVPWGLAAIRAPPGTGIDDAPASGGCSPYQEFSQLRRRAMARAAATAGGSAMWRSAAGDGGADGAAASRAGSCASRAPPRPGCPTPGSDWSVDSGRDSPDPASVLAGAGGSWSGAAGPTAEGAGHAARASRLGGGALAAAGSCPAELQDLGAATTGAAAQPAGGPAPTCGARLDRTARSRLLTPSVQVHLLFGGGDAEASAAGAPVVPVQAVQSEATAQAEGEAEAAVGASSPARRSLSGLLEDYRRQAQQTAAVLSDIAGIVGDDASGGAGRAGPVPSATAPRGIAPRDTSSVSAARTAPGRVQALVDAAESLTPLPPRARGSVESGPCGGADTAADADAPSRRCVSPLAAVGARSQLAAAEPPGKRADAAVGSVAGALRALISGSLGRAATRDQGSSPDRSKGGVGPMVDGSSAGHAASGAPEAHSQDHQEASSQPGGAGGSRWRGRRRD